MNQKIFYLKNDLKFYEFKFRKTEIDWVIQKKIIKNPIKKLSGLEKKYNLILFSMFECEKIHL